MHDIIYIYICIAIRDHASSVPRLHGSLDGAAGSEASLDGFLLPSLGWHHLSNTTCVIRPLLFYVVFVASRSAMICCIFRHA